MKNEKLRGRKKSVYGFFFFCVWEQLVIDFYEFLCGRIIMIVILAWRVVDSR